MTYQHDKPMRWRPRFSVRTLLIIVTLVCCYVACWGPTKAWGTKDIGGELSVAIAPLIVENTHFGLGGVMIEHEGESVRSVQRHYYLWFFGYSVQLPYQTILPITGLRR